MRRFALFIAVLSVVALLPDAGRADECPKDTSAALDVARAALQANDSEQDRRALSCLVQAVAQLNDELQGLRSGALPFTGPLALPKASTSDSKLEAE